MTVKTWPALDAMAAANGLELYREVSNPGDGVTICRLSDHEPMFTMVGCAPLTDEHAEIVTLAACEAVLQALKGLRV